MIVTFLSIMELVRESLIEFVQTEAFAPIHVRAAAGSVDSPPLFLTNYGGEENSDANDPDPEEADE